MKPPAYKARTTKYVESLCDNKIQGVLDKVFALHVPQAQSPAIVADKVEGFLVNVFGVKLPSENTASAWSFTLSDEKSTR